MIFSLLQRRHRGAAERTVRALPRGRLDQVRGRRAQASLRTTVKFVFLTVKRSALVQSPCFNN